MPSRSSRKKVDYSKFNDDRDGLSDDDFQDSPNAPPAKRSKTTEQPARKEKQVSLPKLKEINEKKRLKNEREISKNIAVINRKSREEKHFERDLELAMDLSKKQSDDVIVIDVDHRSEKNSEASQAEIADKNELICTVKENEPSELFPSRSEVNGNEELLKSQPSTSKRKIRKETKNDDDEEYTVGSNEDADICDEYYTDEDDRDDDDDDDDEDFCEESEDNEFKISKNRNQKCKSSTVVMKTGRNKEASKIPKNVMKGKKAEKKTANQSKKSVASIKSTEVKWTPGSSTAKVQTGCAAIRVGLKSPLGSGGTKTRANLPSSSSASSQSQLSPGLGGISMKNTGRSGIRLGLSRNTRVSKPLHSSVSLKSI